MSTYVGEHKDRLRHGRGTYAFPPHGLFQYTGEWHCGEMHGQGVFSMGQLQQQVVLCGSSVYEGEFQNGEIEGIGLRRWANGDSYSGQFRRGELHGEGVFIAHSGERYEGQWCANQRFGAGELTLANGDVYTGAFAYHKPHGRGRIVYAVSKQSFDGEWQRGVITGVGVLCDRDGETLYDGEWREGQREGRGSGALLPGGADSVRSSEHVGEPVWYTGTWHASCPTERATRLEVKLVAPPSGSTGSSSRPVSTAAGVPADNAQQDASSEGEDEQLLDLPPTLSVENKTLPRLVVLSTVDGCTTDNGTADGDLIVVHGESCRRIRLRMFEGLFGADQSAESTVTSDEQQPGTEQVSDAPRSTQWHFVLLDSDNGSSEQPAAATEDEAEAEKSAGQQASQLPESDGDASATTLADDDNAVSVKQQERRVDEVIIENADGKAYVEGLALPVTTLPGSYHILCESLASSDALAPVVINLLVV